MEKQVAGLDIAMQEPTRVKVLYAPARFLHVPDGVSHCHWSPAVTILNASSLQILHSDDRNTVFGISGENLNNIFMSCHHHRLSFSICE
nr:hypothetical protein [Paenarthrobacter histidinolovorans]